MISTNFIFVCHSFSVKVYVNGDEVGQLSDWQAVKLSGVRSGTVGLPLYFYSCCTVAFPLWHGTHLLLSTSCYYQCVPSSSCSYFLFMCQFNGPDSTYMPPHTHTPTFTLAGAARVVFLFIHAAESAPCLGESCGGRGAETIVWQPGTAHCGWLSG